VSDLPDLRVFARVEPLLPTATVIVRGGPDTGEKLRTHAQRVRRAFLLDGEPVPGISVFAALDDIGPGSLASALHLHEARAVERLRPLKSGAGPGERWFCVVSRVVSGRTQWVWG